jgi:hypothetical protein
VRGAKYHLGLTLIYTLLSAREKLEALRRSLVERRENLRQARSFLPASAIVATSPATSPGPTNAASQANSIPFISTQSPATTASRLSRLFPFPSSSVTTPPSPSSKRHKSPNPLAEAKQALVAMGDALAETRSVLVRELAEAYELQEELRQGAGGQEECIWTLGRMELPPVEEVSSKLYPLSWEVHRLIVHYVCRV